MTHARNLQIIKLFGWIGVHIFFFLVGCVIRKCRGLALGDEYVGIGNSPE